MFIAVPNISFLSDPTLTRDNIIGVMGEVEMWDSKQSDRYFDMPYDSHTTIVRQHSMETHDCKVAMIDELLTKHPYPRWEQWVDLLKDMEGEGQARAGLAQEVKDKYITSKWKAFTHDYACVITHYGSTVYIGIAMACSH